MKCPEPGCLQQLTTDLTGVRAHMWNAHRVAVDQLDVIVMAGDAQEDDAREEDGR